MLDRLDDYFRLLVDLLHVVHQVLEAAIALVRVFQQANPLEVAHPVHKRMTFHRGVDHYIRLVWLFVLVVLIGKIENCLFLELPLEGNVEVDQLVSENVGERLGVGDDALYYVFVIA